MKLISALRYALALSAITTVSPAYAQTAEAVPGDGISDQLFESKNMLDLDAPKKSTFSLTVAGKFAPTLSGNAPIEDEERLTDYQTNSLSAEAKKTFFQDKANGLGLDLVADGGFKHNIDADLDSTEDDDFESALYGNLKLDWQRGVKRLSPVVGYGYEKGYRNILEDTAYRDHKLTFGFTFKTTRYVDEADYERMSFNLSVTMERLWSTNNVARDRWTPRLAGELKGELARGLKWNFIAAGERRIFDKIGTDRRLDWRISGFAGVDAAKLIDFDSKVLREMKFGVRWNLNESNVEAKEFSTFNLLPIITIGTKWTGKPRG